MTVFDTLRYPVTKHDLLHGDLLDRLPYYLVRKWWVEMMSQRITGYVIQDNEDIVYIRWWLSGLNDHRLAPWLFELKETIRKWDT